MTTSRVPDDTPASEAVTRALGENTGRTISHYRILGRLGAGGMGVVYKAEDQRLARLVAIKVLAADVGTGSGEEARLRRERFMLEAKAASALDHPNIANIHEIDETADGEIFIVMAYYGGISLKDRIARGPLPVDEAVATLCQIARGLAAAHAHGIVHRDIKPANIMVTAEGVAKIIDFGLAKLENVASLTQTGTTVGTVAYMSPEQVRGEAVDARTDLWSLGVVLYQMLTARLPFRGDRQGSVIRSILDDRPEPLTSYRPDTPVELQTIVARALEKEPQRRYRSADELGCDLERLQAGLALPRAAEPVRRRLARAVRRPAVLTLAILALAVMGSLAVRAIDGLRHVRWARQEAIPRAMELAKKEDYKAAFDLAREAESYIPDDPVLRQVWSEVASEWRISTTPPEAEIYYRDARAPLRPWEFLGRSDTGPVLVPKGLWHVSIRKSGYVTSERMLRPYEPPRSISLDEEGTVPMDMIRLSGGSGSGIPYLSFPNFQAFERIRLGEFLADKFEVTNRAFKAFVDGGGYSDARYWKHGFVDQGKTIPWKEAMVRFTDRTGRPGPATWEFGRYPDGQDEYPVTGVSWYEAAAYAEFAGKTLPTVYHWAAAAAPYAAEFTQPVRAGRRLERRAVSVRRTPRQAGIRSIARDRIPVHQGYVRGVDTG